LVFLVAFHLRIDMASRRGVSITRLYHDLMGD